MASSSLRILNKGGLAESSHMRTITLFKETTISQTSRSSSLCSSTRPPNKPAQHGTLPTDRLDIESVSGVYEPGPWTGYILTLVDMLGRGL